MWRCMKCLPGTTVKWCRGRAQLRRVNVEVVDYVDVAASVPIDLDHPGVFYHWLDH